MADNVKTVGFLKGLQASLPWSNAAAGSFYLTTDTNRLYVGGDDNTLRELNRYIHIADTQAQLANPPFKPQEGDFAFVKEGNLLVVYMTYTDGEGVSKTGWVHINPDTNTNDNVDTVVDGISGTATATAATKLDVALVISQVEKDLIAGSATDLSDVTGTVTITKQNLIDVLSLAVATAVTKTETENYALTTIKSGEDEVGSVKVVAGNNVSISATDGGYKIDVLADQIKTEYDLANSGTKITLTMDGSEASGEVELKAGTDLEVSGATGSITYSHKAYDTASASVTNDETLKSDGTGKLNIISGITLSNGHVTAIEVDELALPDDVHAAAVSADNAGKIHITLSNDVVVDGAADLYYTLGDNEEKYYNQAALPVYTKKEVDDKIVAELADINAMVFQGAVPSAGLPTSNVKIGDTYILNSSEIEVAGMNVGDLAIARGTEGDNGYITGEVEWVIVPSADEVVITYNVERDGNSLKLMGSDDSIETVKFLAGTENNDIIVTPATEAENIETFTFAHKTYSDTIEGLEDQGALTHGGTFKIIKNIVVSNGHVTGIETDELTLPEDKDTKYNLTGANGTVSLMEDGEKEVGSITITGVESNPVSVTVDHENNDSIFEVAHEKATIDTAAAADTELAHGGTLTVYDVDVDEYGHATSRKAHTYKLPSESIYTLSLGDDGVEGDTGYTVKLMKNGSELQGSYTVNSSSLQITANTNAATVDIVWGSF